ncbi:MAG TPA: co-chaperone DjlA [Steroidobacteraceae bacterium]|jgi:DnaJ like chaperone protein|nr:co-chaperone DjlA [Steroidobacteraceae bacterium]
MNWEGKLIGGTLGLVTLGPLGAAIGALVGHLFDSGQLSGAMFGAGPDPRLVNELFFPTTFRVMGHIAKADGRVTEQEIASARAIMHTLHLQPPQIQAAIGYFTEGKQPGFDLDSALSRLRASIARYPDLAQFFVEIQLQASLAGDGLSEVPRARLQRVALLLGLSATDFARLENLLRFRARASAGGAAPGYGTGGAGAGSATGAAAGSYDWIAQAYSLLEATPQMSDEEVVKAYRRQMSRHHPDKLKANGLPPSMLERAKERTQQIQTAYEVIRERRGMR